MAIQTPPRVEKDSLPTRIRRRLSTWGRGAIFVPPDFLDLGTRAAVDAALSRATAAREIRRLARGVYDLPLPSSRFGPRLPSTRKVADAIARATGESICNDGAFAANSLGLSTQVPGRTTFLTDGTTRTVTLHLDATHSFKIHFRHSKRRAGGDSVAGLIVRALHFMGREAVSPERLKALRESLTDEDHRQLLALKPRAVGWLHASIDQMTEAPSSPRA